MRNGDGNLLIMTFYIIGLSYVINLMIDSIDDKIKFIYDKAAVGEQLKEYGLADNVDIILKFNPFNGLEELKNLLLIITNKSEKKGIYIDWDNSSIVVDHDNASRRVIRMSPDMTRDLGLTQTPSLIAPKKTLAQPMTAEDVFTFDAEKRTYANSKPLIDITGRGLKNSPQKPKRLLYKAFMSRRKDLYFSLQLVLRISQFEDEKDEKDLRVGLVPGENKPQMYLINCPVTIKKLPWTYAMPWNKRR